MSSQEARSAEAKAKRAPAHKTVRVDAKTWARLEAAAKHLSKALGREVPPEALFVAGVEAMAAVRKACAEARQER